MAPTSEMLDADYGTAKELWDARETHYRTSNEQSAINMMLELGSLEFREGHSWENHLSKFHEILTNIATLDKQVDEKEKLSKLFRIIP